MAWKKQHFVQRAWHNLLITDHHAVEIWWTMFIIMVSIASTSNASALLWMWAFQLNPATIHTQKSTALTHFLNGHAWSYWIRSWNLTTLFRVSVKMICNKKNRTACFCHGSLQSMPRKTPSGKHALSSPEHLSKSSQEANKWIAIHAAGTRQLVARVVPLSQQVLTAHFDLDWCSIYSHKSTTVIAECLCSCSILFLLISSDPHRDLFEDCNWSPPRKGRQMPAGLAGSSPLATPEVEAPQQGPWSKRSQQLKPNPVVQQDTDQICPIMDVRTIWTPFVCGNILSRAVAKRAGVSIDCAPVGALFENENIEKLWQKWITQKKGIPGSLKVQGAIFPRYLKLGPVFIQHVSLKSTAL